MDQIEGVALEIENGPMDKGAERWTKLKARKTEAGIDSKRSVMEGKTQATIPNCHDAGRGKGKVALQRGKNWGKDRLGLNSRGCEIFPKRS